MLSRDRGRVPVEVEATRWYLLLLEVGRRLGRRLGLFPPRPEAVRWSWRGVADAEGPALNVRNYLERRNLRNALRVAGAGRIAAELGCGYGRVTMVLTEFYEEVHGFEREPELLEIARPLLPSIRFHQVPRLAAFVEAVPERFDLVMTNNVLQHVPDEEVIEVLEVAKARLTPTGHLLLAEKTDTRPAAQVGTSCSPGSFFSRGRPVETWTAWAKPLRLKHSRPVEAEPTYHSPANPDHRNVGTVMLFGA